MLPKPKIMLNLAGIVGKIARIVDLMHLSFVLFDYRSLGAHTQLFSFYFESKSWGATLTNTGEYGKTRVPWPKKH